MSPRTRPVRYAMHLLLSALLILPGLALAQVWHLVNPRPTPEQLFSCVHSAGSWFGVGAFGTVIGSDDGIVWSKRNSVPSTTNLVDIVSVDGHLVAISNSEVFTSIDGDSWSTPVPFEPDFSSLAREILHDGSRYVVAADDELYTSTDAINWTVQASPVSGAVGGIAFSGSRYVLVGSAGQIYTSEDLDSWTVRASPVAINLLGVAYGASGFVVGVEAAGTVLTSADGISWAPASLGTVSSGGKVGFDGQRYLATAGSVFGSTDMVNWTELYSTPRGRMAAVCGDGLGRAVAVGGGGQVASSMNINGSGWAARTPSLAQLLVVASNGSRFVAGGAGGTLLSSANGASWEQVDLSGAGPIGGDFVAVLWMAGRSEFAALTGSRLLTSSNGIDWSATILPFGAINMASNGDRLVVVGAAGEVYYSDDLIDWTLVDIGSVAGLGIAFVNNHFLIWEGLPDGRSFVSADGISWSGGGSNNINSPRGIAFGNGVYSSGRVYSTDALTWQPVPVVRTGIGGPSFDGERFFALNQFTNAGANVYTSADGINWSTAETLGGHGLAGSAQAASSSVLVGDGGAIYFFSKVEIIESGDSTAMIEGGSDSYTVRLLSPPEAPVTVTLTPETSELQLSVAELEFTVDNWNTARTVIVSVDDDLINQGDRTLDISHSFSSTDANYDGIPAPDVSVSISDNDIANIDTDIPATLVVSEAGATVQYSLVLESQPTADVVIDLTPDGRLQTSPTSLVFTSANWQSAQTVTLSVADDPIAQGTQMLSVSHAVTSTDVAYDNFVVPDVSVTANDNDSAGVTVTGAPLLLEEGGITDTLTLLLTSEPLGNVTVTLTADAQLQLSQAAVVFTSANWDTPVEVLVTAVDDDVREDDHASLLTLSVASADGTYNGLSLSAVSVAITDNDTGGSSGGGGVTVALLALMGLLGWRRRRD